jgi:protein-L-isoaspartate(D-aspartate) O-methyltransferase
MVEVQLRARGIRDLRVLAAMAAVPREAFVPARLRHRAYADEALPVEEGQTISQPLMVGLMTQLLDPDPGDRVLEVGTGTGYQAAVLAAMGCRVTTIERLEPLARTARERLVALGYGEAVEVRVGDGGAGAPDGTPWPRILVAAAAPSVPQLLVDQLADGGRLVLPVGPRWEQELVLVERRGTEVRRTDHGGCVFVPLIGEGGYR